MAKYDGKIAGLYDLESTIGKGHFAVVKLARHVFTGEKVAVKVIDKTKLDAVSKANLFQEVRCMKLVQHAHVVRLYEVIDTQTKLYLVLELGDGGDLFEYIMKHESGVSEEIARKYFQQIVAAIHYCHGLHVVHRDLKPENVVFFNKLGIVKLTDFGFSNKFVPGKELETSCGTLAYSAPELLLGDSYDPPAVDVWSLGVILFMLVSGKAPFQEANDSETLTMIMDCKYHVPSHISPACSELISQMLVRAPERRASLKQILQHKWLAFCQARVDSVPLIKRQSITDEDHSIIVQRMADGKIASQEEIRRAIEADEYNHVTATYYLLAERRLKKHSSSNLSSEACQNAKLARPRLQPAPEAQILPPKMLPPLKLIPLDVCEENSAEVANHIELAYNVSTNKQAISPLALSPRLTCRLDAAASTTIDTLCSPIAQQTVPCSFLSSPHSLCSGTRILTPSSAPPSNSSIQVSRPSSEDNSAEETDDSDQLSPAHSNRAGNSLRSLHSVKSSPLLLKQIFEEDTDEEGLRLSRRNQVETNMPGSPEVVYRLELQQRKRLVPGASRSGPSASSSDTSDTEDGETKKRNCKPRQRAPLNRRDSSSDTDGGRSVHSSLNGNCAATGLMTCSSKKCSPSSSNCQSDKRTSTNNQNESESGDEKLYQHCRKATSRNTRLLARSVSPLKDCTDINIEPRCLPHTSLLLVEDLGSKNDENKFRNNVIHVRSKNFTDLIQQFGPSGSSTGKKLNMARSNGMVAAQASTS